MDRQILINKLVIIKQLYNQGIEQSSKSENIACFSILSFHDSVEFLLHLYNEFKGSEPPFSFMENWKKYKELPYKHQMSSLNKLRRQLKHHSSIPGKFEIEKAKIYTKDFLIDTVKLIDNIDFDEISLTELISNYKVKRFLLKAEKNNTLNKSEKVLEYTAKAFHTLINDYQEKAKGYFNNPFDFGKKVNHKKSIRYSIRNKGDKILESINEIDSKIKLLTDSVNQIQIAMKVISLGIDYRKYTKFRYYTPVTSENQSGDIICEMPSAFIKEEYSKEELNFLIDFVIESALILQDFEVDHSRINFKNPFIA